LFLIGQFIKKFSETAWPNELKLTNQQQQSPVAAMFVNGSARYAPYL
jgi:hypothetical protein